MEALLIPTDEQLEAVTAAALLAADLDLGDANTVLGYFGPDTPAFRAWLILTVPGFAPDPLTEEVIGAADKLQSTVLFGDLAECCAGRDHGYGAPRWECCQETREASLLDAVAVLLGHVGPAAFA